MNLAEAKEYAKKNIHNRPATTGRLAGKIAVVTGGAQGFGLGIATEMYNEGASVVLADLNVDQAKEAAKTFGDRAVGLKVDVSDPGFHGADGLRCGRAFWRHRHFCIQCRRSESRQPG